MDLAYYRADLLESYACGAGCVFCCYGCNPGTPGKVELDTVGDFFQQSAKIGLNHSAVSVMHLDNSDLYPHLEIIKAAGLTSSLVVEQQTQTSPREVMDGLEFHAQTHDVMTVKFSFFGMEEATIANIAYCVAGVVSYNQKEIMRAIREPNTVPKLMNAAIHILDFYDDGAGFGKNKMNPFKRLFDVAKGDFFQFEEEKMRFTDLTYGYHLYGKEIPVTIWFDKSPVMPVGNALNFPMSRFSQIPDDELGDSWSCLQLAILLTPERVEGGGHIIKPCDSLFQAQSDRMGVYVPRGKSFDLDAIVTQFRESTFLNTLDSIPEEDMRELGRDFGLPMDDIVALCQVCTLYHEQDTHFQSEFLEAMEVLQPTS